MKKIVSSRELTESAKRVAQSKRVKSLQDRKNYVMSELQDCPPLLCLNELANTSIISIIIISYSIWMN